MDKQAGHKFRDKVNDKICQYKLYCLHALKLVATSIHGENAKSSFPWWQPHWFYTRDIKFSLLNRAKMSDENTLRNRISKMQRYLNCHDVMWNVNKCTDMLITLPMRPQPAQPAHQHEPQSRSTRLNLVNFLPCYHRCSTALAHLCAHSIKWLLTERTQHPFQRLSRGSIHTPQRIKALTANSLSSQAMSCNASSCPAGCKVWATMKSSVNCWQYLTTSTTDCQVLSMADSNYRFFVAPGNVVHAMAKF